MPTHRSGSRCSSRNRQRSERHAPEPPGLLSGSSRRGPSIGPVGSTGRSFADGHQNHPRRSAAVSANSNRRFQCVTLSAYLGMLRGATETSSANDAHRNRRGYFRSVAPSSRWRATCAFANGNCQLTGPANRPRRSAAVSANFTRRFRCVTASVYCGRMRGATVVGRGRALRCNARPDGGCATRSSRCHREPRQNRKGGWPSGLALHATLDRDLQAVPMRNGSANDAHRNRRSYFRSVAPGQLGVQPVRSPR